MILMALILGVMLLMNNNNDKLAESPNAQSTTATFVVSSYAYGGVSSVVTMPADISATLLYNGKNKIVSLGMYKGTYSTSDSISCSTSREGKYSAGALFIRKNRVLQLNISSLAIGTRLAGVYATYSRGNSFVSDLIDVYYESSNNETSYSDSISFDVGDATESDTQVNIFVFYHFKYNFYGLDNNGNLTSSHEVWVGQYLSAQKYSGYSYSDYKRTGYTLEGFYTRQNGKGSKIFDVDSNNNLSLVRYYPSPDTSLYAYYTPKDYRVDVNVLNPNGTQDYKSGTFTQYYSYTDSTSNNLTDQAYSTIKQGSYTEIRNIVPVAGYYLYNVTATVGTIENRGNGVYRYTASFSSEPKGSSSWDAVINVQMRYINYSVIFNANGGSGTMSNQSFTYGTAKNLIKNSFTRTGYTFVGWNTKADGSGTSYSDGELVNNLSSANTNNATVTLYAQWDTNQLIATLYYQDGETTNTTTSSYYSSSSTKLGLPELSRTGYEFKGWSLTPNNTGVYYDADSNWNNVTVNGTTVSTPNAGGIYFNLYAIWEANEYSVNVNIYNPNGVEEYTSNINGTFTLKDDEGNVITGLYNEPSDHYITFGKSWQVYDIVAGTGRKLRTTNPVTCGNGLTMSESNNVYTFTCTGTSGHTINIYMEYISYTIAFNGNGSTGGSMDTIENVKYDSDQKLAANGFIKAGYVFTGWNTKSDGTGTPYSDKATVKNLTIKDGDTVTLFAQWQSTIASGITEVYEDAGTYYINTADDLAKLIYTTESKAVGNGFTFIQTANIDLSNLTYLPIGRLNSFSATYDGQGYTISGLSSYNGTDANDNYLETNGGLFANAGGAKIKNVIIENATIYGQNAGIIAGIGNEGTKISNCVVSGTVNGTNAGSIIGNGNGASITACLAKGVNTASFAGGSANVDSCIYELTDGTRGVSDSFNDYSAWVYPSNFAYPMPKAFIWYPYPELSEDSLNTWLGK